MTPKDIHKIFIPQKIFIFLKTLKGIEIQNFEPQNGASPRMNENIIVPPPLHPLLADRNRGRGVQTQITEKTLIRVFFLFCFFVFFGDGGGGKCLFPTKLKELVIIIYFYLFFFFFFFFWGGGVYGPPIPLWIRTSVRNK